MNNFEDPLAAKGVVTHIDEHKFSSDVSNYRELIADAAQADQVEHTISLRDSFRIHKKAIVWSMLLSGALIMEGYDVVVVASFYGQPSFLRRFGTPNPHGGQNIISAEWQSGLGNGSSAGGIIGLLINGWAAERFGAKTTMIASLIWLIGAIAIDVFANSLGMLVAGSVLCGVAWGVFQTLTTAYASEVCPINLRHYLTAYINMCWGIGILLSSGVVRAVLPMTNDWGWKLPFVIQWVWIPPLMLIAWFSPVSPWWLVRQGRYADAEASVRRLTNPDYFSEEECKRSVAMMIYTTELEKLQEVGTSYRDCFKGVDRRRTEIAMMVFAIQLLSGQNLIGQGVQFLERVGIDDTTTFDLNIVLDSMFCIGTIISWGLLYKFGRRTLYLSGCIAMAVVLLVTGCLAFDKSSGASWGAGILLICLNLVYNSTLGPVCYTLISEVGSTRLRGKTVALSRVSYQIINIICGIIMPRMLSPTSWNWGQKCAFFWLGSCLFCIAYVYLRVPETRGRSYAELDTLFENGVPAWKFSSTKVDQFAGAGGALKQTTSSQGQLESADEKMVDETIEKI